MAIEPNKIYCGDAQAVLRNFPDNSIDCVVTSPPYYGLRDYGVAGQIGLENSPEEYVGRLMDVSRQVFRVLKPDGTFWLNIGDSYAGSGRGKGDVNRKGIQPEASYTGDFINPYRLKGYKSKDLIGIPWMLAFALRADGWFLRQDIIWQKPNPMPESVKDRCTKAHEYLFLLTKSARYYFDSEAILEPAAYDGRKDTFYKGGDKDVNCTAHERWPRQIRGFAAKEGETGLRPSRHGANIPTCRARNRRSVWTVSTRGFRGAHFATFPPDLIRPCIAAGCRLNGVVLDPFMGAGTTAIVAQELGRNYVGIELNDDYVRMSEKRINLHNF